jgi:hypothetical protein
MHPYEYQQLITERRDELARASAQLRLSQSTAWHQMRQNAGWLLVHIGLRLALGRPARPGAASPA